MNYDKYNIDYIQSKFNGKPVFIFINHKTAVLCWAKIKNLFGNFNVVTFDSHRDFHEGVINKEDVLKKELFLGSKYISHFPHFTTCNEFVNWDLLNDEQNKRFIQLEKKFLLFTNDNFIDVAFMKDIVGDVFWYYIDTYGNVKKGICDDFNGLTHKYLPNQIKSFNKQTEKFVLDIDLDFFAPQKDDLKPQILSEKEIEKNLILQKELAQSDACLGITIALEPYFCGSKENCLNLCKRLFGILGLNIETEMEKIKGLFS